MHPGGSLYLSPSRVLDQGTAWAESDAPRVAPSGAGANEQRSLSHGLRYILHNLLKG